MNEYFFNEKTPSDVGFNPKAGIYSRYLPSAAQRRWPGRPERDKKIHAVFQLVGFVTGLAGAFAAYDRTSSIALPIYVFFMVSYFVGRAVGDVVTDPHKVQRFIYFALPIVFMSGILYGTYLWWGLMWLSTIIGVLLGGVLWAIVGALLFPRIHQDEQEDTQTRTKDHVAF